MPTKIEWAEESWNPVTGCTKVSEGCANCYADRMAMRFTGHFNVTYHSDRLDQPLHWRKPRRIFVCSMGDLFHSAVDGKWQHSILWTMKNAKQHQFLLLTKRPSLMKFTLDSATHWTGDHEPLWPLPNVWLGVTAENQEWWEKRKEAFFATPAAIHFVSNEPLIGEIVYTKKDLRRLDHVIIGGESGPKARPLHPDWVRSIRDQCVATGTPFFFKQWGEWSLDSGDYSNLPYGEFHGMADWVESCRCVEGTQEMVRIGKKRAGCVLDGRQWREYPE